MTVPDKSDDRVLRVRVTEALLDVLAPGLPPSDVRVAVDAVIKLVREQAAQDIEAAKAAETGRTPVAAGYRLGLEDAAEIVRGGR